MNCSGCNPMTSRASTLLCVDGLAAQIFDDRALPVGERGFEILLDVLELLELSAVENLPERVLPATHPNRSGSSAEASNSNPQRSAVQTSDAWW